MSREGKKPTARLVRCPNCRKSVVYDTANPCRPFCSAFCKDQDIIAWAEGDYKVPGPPADPNDVLQALQNAKRDEES